MEEDKVSSSGQRQLCAEGQKLADVVEEVHRLRLRHGTPELDEFLRGKGYSPRKKLE